MHDVFPLAREAIPTWPTPPLLLPHHSILQSRDLILWKSLIIVFLLRLLLSIGFEFFGATSLVHGIGFLVELMGCFVIQVRGSKVQVVRGVVEIGVRLRPLKQSDIRGKSIIFLYPRFHLMSVFVRRCSIKFLQLPSDKVGWLLCLYLDQHLRLWVYLSFCLLWEDRWWHILPNRRLILHKSLRMWLQPKHHITAVVTFSKVLGAWFLMFGVLAGLKGGMVDSGHEQVIFRLHLMLIRQHPNYFLISRRCLHLTHILDRVVRSQGRLLLRLRNVIIRRQFFLPRVQPVFAIPLHSLLNVIF